MAAWLLTLAVFAGLSMNLVLQLGVGVREIALGADAPERPAEGPLAARLLAFLAPVLLLWLAFSLARSLVPLGFAEYLLVFPVSFAASSALGRLLARVSAGGDGARGGSLAGGASVGAALFVALAVAGGFAEALALSVGFALGSLLAGAIAAEIRKRAETEAVPRWLRGAPLALVSLGLLSLVFYSVAAVFFEALGNG